MALVSVEMFGVMINCGRVTGGYRGGYGFDAHVHDVSDMSSRDSAGFFDVDDAIAWGRARAPIVLVYVGEEVYSAGDLHELRAPDGELMRWPEWPPPSDVWPASIPERRVIYGQGWLNNPER